MNQYNISYNHTSEAICAIEPLGIYQTRWNNIHHDTHPNQQKLYCKVNGELDLVIKAEYSENAALLEVYHAAEFPNISTPAPEYADEVLKAVQTVYLNAQIVGESRFIRVVIEEHAQ